jgi:hypothetical protein
MRLEIFVTDLERRLTQPPHTPSSARFDVAGDFVEV